MRFFIYFVWKGCIWITLLFKSLLHFKSLNHFWAEYLSLWSWLPSAYRLRKPMVNFSLVWVPFISFIAPNMWMIVAPRRVGQLYNLIKSGLIKFWKWVGYLQLCSSSSLCVQLQLHTECNAQYVPSPKVSSQVYPLNCILYVRVVCHEF